MASVRFGLFIEPDESFGELILAWKRRVGERWPAAAYLSHPPHCTLWVGDIDNAIATESAIATAASALSPLTLTIRSPRVFFDDPMAAGGQTCAFEAAQDRLLVRVQQAFCDTISAHRSPASSTDPLPSPLRVEPFQSSWRAYGFPFVGEHWIPHFTVASIPVRRDDPFVLEFLESPVDLELAVRRVSWWRIVGDHHDRLAGFSLDAGATL